MGIRFNTNTWRAPLLLIDSWLPATPSARTDTVPPKAVQRFARAGWLGRVAEVTPKVAPCPATAIRPQSPAGNGRACHVRVLSAAETTTSILRNDTRLVISGRISDVCAELDRLAALEHQVTKA